MPKNKEMVKQLSRKLLESVEFSSTPEMDAKRQIRVVAASGKPDRSGDIVVTSGILLEEFKKNPIILWAHDHYGLPVAQAVEVGLVKGRLEMVLEFATAEVYAFADTVYKLIKGKFLRGVSIGAQVLEAEWMFDKETEEIIGRKFTALNLLELSIVPIPADSRALIQAYDAKKITAAEMAETLEKSFDAPLDLEAINRVQVEISTVRSFSEEEMPIDLSPLETRLSALETALKAGNEASIGQNAKVMEALTGIMSSFSKKEIPDVASVTKVLADALPPEAHAAFTTLLDSMTKKLSVSR